MEKLLQSKFLLILENTYVIYKTNVNSLFPSIKDSSGQAKYFLSYCKAAFAQKM